MSAIARSMMFLSSYAPLFGFLALLQTFGGGWPTMVCIAVAVFGLALIGVVRATMRQLAPQRLVVSGVQHRDGDALAYVMTFIIPFATMAVDTPRSKIAIALFIALIAILYVRAELFYVNPVLALVGLRLFQITTPSGTSAVLITRRSFLPANSETNACRLGNYVYWEQRNDD